MVAVGNVNWIKKTQDRIARLAGQTIRVGVTGLSGAGKTTFITSLINQLENHQRGLLARRSPFDRLVSVRWQRDGVANPFPYIEALGALSATPAHWPSTSRW